MQAPHLIYEDQDLLVVDKPSGKLVTEVQAALAPAKLAHRLDRETSGVLLLAKNESALEYLQQLFRERRVKKTYWAIVCGAVKREAGTIDLPIGRSQKDPRRRVASLKAFGRLRPARTNFQVLERWPDFTLLEIRPETGRTHQIRVHLKSFGYPLAGDRLYGAPANAPGLGRLALHAVSVEFKDRAGRSLKLLAPLPEDFSLALAHLREKC